MIVLIPELSKINARNEITLNNQYFNNKELHEILLIIIHIIRRSLRVEVNSSDYEYVYKQIKNINNQTCTTQTNQISEGDRLTKQKM